MHVFFLLNVSLIKVCLCLCNFTGIQIPFWYPDHIILSHVFHYFPSLVVSHYLDFDMCALVTIKQIAFKNKTTQSNVQGDKRQMRKIENY